MTAFSFSSFWGDKVNN